MTNATSESEQQLEQMVAAHVAALRKAAQGAVEHAFEAASTSAPMVAQSHPRASHAATKRRAGAEPSALGERFFEALSLLCCLSESKDYNAFAHAFSVATSDVVILRTLKGRIEPGRV
jgi:hypothetical protein